MKNKDILWKGILQDLFEDFLRFIYRDADELFDFSKGFEFLDKELEQLFPPVGDAGPLRFVDKLVKVYLKEGGEKWMLVHVEVQGYHDLEFPKRMFQYYTRIFDRYEQPITAWAIFTDASRSYHPKQYEDTVLGTKITYEFNTYKIIEQDDTRLAASENPFAVVVLAAKPAMSRKRIKDEQLFGNALYLAKLLLSKQIAKDKVRRVLYFLNRYINFDNNEMITKFEQEIATLTERSIAMGIEELIGDLAIKEAREEGREKNTFEVTIKMLRNGIDINLISNVTGLSVEEIEKLAKDTL